MSVPETGAEATPETESTAEVESPPADWQRLDQRMVLVLPVRELIRFLPALVALALAGSFSGGSSWQFLGVLVPIVLGLFRYLTTSYRIHGDRVELKTGLLNRRVSTVQLDRVRTVDISAALLQRLLGLITLKIGTATGGGDGDRLDLDGLPADRGRQLRDELLGRAALIDGSDSSVESAIATKEPDPLRTAARFELSWLRFAPLTSAGLVVTGGLMGLAAQGMQMLDGWDRLESSTLELPVPMVAAIAILIFVGAIAVVVFSVLGYLVANWGFRLDRQRDSWTVRRGLFTTREITLDEQRIAGVTLNEGLGVRAAGGASLQAIVTGLDSGESGSAMLTPPVDRATVHRAAIDVLGDSEPIKSALVGHGEQAARRRWVRAMIPAGVVAAVLIAIVAATDLPLAFHVFPIAVVAAAAVLAKDRVRSLGHRLTSQHLVARSGSLVRRRQVLSVEHIIGWNFRSTWFQRRAGLTNALATTAGGPQGVLVLDVPAVQAEQLAAVALPGLLEQFSSKPERHEKHA